MFFLYLGVMMKFYCKHVTLKKHKSMLKTQQDFAGWKFYVEAESTAFTYNVVRANTYAKINFFDAGTVKKKALI